VKGRILGLSLCGLATVCGGWEGIAIADGAGGVPTISRVVQGVRDASLAGFVFVVGLLLAIVAGSLWFLIWLVHHWIQERRSTL
jgi:hypothetical protein